MRRSTNLDAVFSSLLLFCLSWNSTWIRSELISISRIKESWVELPGSENGVNTSSCCLINLCSFFQKLSLQHSKSYWVHDVRIGAQVVGGLRIGVHGSTKLISDWCKVQNLLTVGAYSDMRGGIAPSIALRDHHTTTTLKTLSCLRDIEKYSNRNEKIMK